MPQPILIQRHALLLKCLHQEPQAVEVFGHDDTVLSKQLSHLCLLLLFLHLFHLFSDYSRPTDLVDVWEQAEEGGVKRHPMPDFLRQVVVREQSLLAVVAAHKEVKLGVS